MAPGLDCMFRDCKFSTFSMVTDGMDSVLWGQVLRAQRYVLEDHMASVHGVPIVPMADNVELDVKPEMLLPLTPALTSRRPLSVTRMLPLQQSNYLKLPRKDAES